MLLNMSSACTPPMQASLGPYDDGYFFGPVHALSAKKKGSEAFVLCEMRIDVRKREKRRKGDKAQSVGQLCGVYCGVL